MANTYTQLHIQVVFAVKYRAASIEKEWKDELHKYITGIIQENGHKMLQVNSMPDHIHVFIGMRPTQSIASLVQNVKAESSKWIKAKIFVQHLLHGRKDMEHFPIPKVMYLMLFVTYKTGSASSERNIFRGIQENTEGF
jgi:REP element-mobilizing transposase RayT